MPIPAFDGQRVVVVGGTSGIGYAVAEAAVAEGAEVVVASREQAKIDAAVQQLGTAATGTMVDVGNEASIAALFNATGAFNHLVFTAGEQGLGPARGSLAQMDLAVAAGALDVRFWGALKAIKHAQAYLSPAGSVTLTDGVLAQMPMKGFPMGGALGSAVQGLVRGLAVDLAPLRVNSVCPGLVLTERLAPWPADMVREMTAHQPLARAANPAEVAQAYLYLMRGTYTTGQVIVVDGGRTLV